MGIIFFISWHFFLWIKDNIFKAPSLKRNSTQWNIFITLKLPYKRHYDMSMDESDSLGGGEGKEKRS